MQTITLHIDEQVFNDLQADILTKRLDKKFEGVAHMVGLAIIEAIRANQPERTLRYKKNSSIINARGR